MKRTNILLFGVPGSGKSSLINVLMSNTIKHTVAKAAKVRDHSTSAICSYRLREGPIIFEFSGWWNWENLFPVSRLHMFLEGRENENSGRLDSRIIDCVMFVISESDITAEKMGKLRMYHDECLKRLIITFVVITKMDLVLPGILSETDFSACVQRLYAGKEFQSLKRIVFEGLRCEPTYVFPMIHYPSNATAPHKLILQLGRKMVDLLMKSFLIIRNFSLMSYSKQQEVRKEEYVRKRIEERICVIMKYKGMYDSSLYMSMSKFGFNILKELNRKEEMILKNLEIDYSKIDIIKTIKATSKAQKTLADIVCKKERKIYLVKYNGKEYIAKEQIGYDIQEVVSEILKLGMFKSEKVVPLLFVSRKSKKSILFLMPKLEGDLYQYFVRSRKKREKMRPLKQKMKVFQQMISCVKLLAAQSLIHCDIKPSNFFYEVKDGDEVVVRIGDFGISKVAPELEIEGVQNGTPGYMSEELLLPKKRVVFSVKSDIFALGISFYEILFERRQPLIKIGKFSENQRKILKSKEIGDLLFPNYEAEKTAGDNLFLELKTLIRAMISKNKDDRPLISVVESAFEKILMKYPDVERGEEIEESEEEEDGEEEEDENTYPVNVASSIISNMKSWRENRVRDYQRIVEDENSVGEKVEYDNTPIVEEDSTQSGTFTGTDCIDSNDESGIERVYKQLDFSNI